MRASQLPTIRRTPTMGTRPSRQIGDVPLVLDRYRLHRRLGAGGFGTVWWARDERLEREVAVKVLPRERVLSGRFEREARAAARLTHPGIVMLYEAAVDDEDAYLVSELVRGATLADLLDAGQLSDRDIVMIGIALCDALSYAHSQGVVHRDLKPSNILVPERPITPAQIVKLTDFGVARVIGGDSLTITGDVIGTAAYMAPEQAEGLEAGAPADLYSLALVIYEALTGVNPVRVGTAAQRARRLGAYLPPLRRQRRDLPRNLGCGIDLALRPRPRERGSMAELRAALSSAVDIVEAKAGVVEGPWRPRSETARRTKGARRAQPEFDSEPIPEHEDDSAPAPAPQWGRGLAAIAAAGLTAWLAAHVLAPSPVAPAAAALLAAAVMIAIPRVGWLLITATLAGATAIDHRPGVAIVLALAGLLPAALLPDAGPTWPLAAGAPALGALGLGGAWPAVAGWASSALRRAALGATGWVWIGVASSLAGGDVYVGRPVGTPAPGIWMGSVHQAIQHVVRPLTTFGALGAMVVWAAAAVVLPWLVRRRSLTADVVRVTIWSALTVAAVTSMLGTVHGRDALVSPSSAVVGAVAGGIVALAPTAADAWRGRGNAPGSEPELA